MNNLKKVGLSALAGSLAMFSATADVTVGGSAEATYTSNSGAGTSLGGNPIGLSHNISVTGTGEMENGFTYSVMTDFDGQTMTRDSSVFKLDMGDLGTVGVDQGVGSFGIGTLENKVPTAWEEADHATGSLAHGIDANGAMNVVGYSNTFMGAGVSVEYNPEISGTTAKEAGGSTGGVSLGSELNFALTYAVPQLEGLTLNYGEAKTAHGTGETGGTDEEVWAVNYAMGPVSVGVSGSSQRTAGAKSQSNRHTGIAVNVNESLSISWGTNKANEKTQEHTVEASTGVMAAYSMGAASLKIAQNTTKNVGGVVDVKDENMEISLALAF